MKAKALSLILMVVLLIGAVCFMIPNVKATNFLSNGNFEDGTWTASNWPLYWHYGQISTDAYEGNQAINLTRSPYSTYQNYSGSFQPNTYYNLSFAFQTTSWIDVAPFINWAASGDDIFNEQYLRRYPNGTWINLFSGSFSVLSEVSIGDWNITTLSIKTTAYMYDEYVHFRINNPYHGYLCIDNIVFSSGSIEIGGLTLNSPSNLAILTNLNVTFSYTPHLSLGIVNASLWLNSYATWQRVVNTTTVTNGTFNNFTYSLPYQGIYLWNIEVWDASNGYFASANYSLTVSSGTVDLGTFYDPCENISKWLYSGFTPTDPVIDTSDYQEGSGSINFSWNSGSSARHEWFDLTPGNCFGFFVKFQINATYSSSASQIMIVYNYTGGSNIGLSILYNGTHYRFGWKWYLAFTYSSWYLIDGSHWYWMECFLVTNKLVDVYVDGAKVFTDTTVVNPVDHLFEFFINNGAWGSSYKFDFLRITDHEEYPVFVTPTIDVVSNPELNAFFSMTTNASSLQTETLCVNGNVSENMADLGHVGTFPWLDTQDDNTSYVQTNLATATYDQYYTFNQTTLLTISSATLHVRLACFPVSSTVGVLVQVYLWNGSSYVSIEGFQRFGDWLTMNSSALFIKGFNTSAMLNQMRLKIWMNLNQQVPGITYMGRLTAVWMDVFGYGNPEGSAIHQTPYSFNPVSATYVFNALNSTIYDDYGNEYSFSGFNYTTGSYVGATLILTSLSGVTSIVLEYSIVVPSGGVFLVPFMFLFWIIGLFCLFLSPIYAIDKVKKREYLVGLVGGVILGAIGFGLFIGGLWGITI